jgi:hypothetical protein
MDKTCGRCGAKGFVKRPAGFDPRWLCYEHWRALPQNQPCEHCGRSLAACVSKPCEPARVRQGLPERPIIGTHQERI